MLGVISILISVFCGWFFWRTVKTVTGDIDLKQDMTQLQTPDKIDVAFFLQKLDIYNAAVMSGNIRRLHSILSDTMFHKTEADAQCLARYGVRREIEYTPNGFIEPSPLMYDGKISMSSVQFPCRYTERYVDNRTGQVLHTTQYENATIVMSITRSDMRDPGEVISCTGCGQPVNTGGELFICQHCGATYTSDSYDWSISGYSVLGDKSATPGLKFASYAVIVLMVLLPILGFVSGRVETLKPVVIIGNILMVGAVLYWGLWSVPSSFRGIFDMRRVDRLFSMQQFFGRSQYLLEIFFSGMNYNPTSLKPFIDPYVYAEIMQNYRPTGNLVLKSEDTGKGKVSGLVNHGGKLYLSTTADVMLTVMDSTRRVQRIKKKLTYQMCRAESAMTTHKLDAEVLQCPGCGRSINLTANGRCKYCGANYDLSQIDWVLARVDNSMII